MPGIARGLEDIDRDLWLMSVWTGWCLTGCSKYVTRCSKYEGALLSSYPQTDD